MKHLRLLAAAAAVALAATLAACSPASNDASSDGGSATQSASATTLHGTFAGLNDKHVTGTVTVTNSSIVLSDFSSDEGPDLHVYLANGTDEAAVAAGKEIDAVAYDTASQTFSISGIDVAMYTEVVIHCDKAAAVFGAAPLS